MNQKIIKLKIVLIFFKLILNNIKEILNKKI